ncbi:MAG: undecaprenyldiphospho-muramoylpentapeptide beta-N-acetylglucosaminyltransferase [Candidatus Paceibacterota bacterium]
MKILLTGGGSGGHFYPIIAIAEEINELVKENRLLKPEIYYMSTDPYNEGLLYQNNITFKKITAGKIRRYFSIKNFFDVFKMFWGSLKALWAVFRIYPDVVFGKGGYASFPAVFAAWILRIPVIIHESDMAPGKVNAFAGKFAVRIATSYPESADYFPKEKTAYTGNPIRKEVMEPLSIGAKEFLKLEEDIPTILILGGSQGSHKINDLIIDSLTDLVKNYQIIHQTGKKNITIMKETADVVLLNNLHKDRYKPFDYLDLLAMRMSAGAADLIISRAGSTIFEIASWGKPSIIIPITKSNGDHQKKNAYSYARSGAAMVIEERNLTSNILISEINRIINNKEEREKMSEAAKRFARKDASRLIAKEILSIGLEHEK